MVINRNKLVIFFTLALLGTLFLFWVFKAPFQTSKNQSFKKKPVTITPIEKKQIVPPIDKREGRRLKSSYSSWGRNPFAPGGAKDISGMILKGIIWDEKAPVAIINEKIVRKGDEIEGKKVIEIEKDKVILYDGKDNIELKLY